jgi:hypothetical protein
MIIQRYRSICKALLAKHSRKASVWPFRLALKDDCIRNIDC